MKIVAAFLFAALGLFAVVAYGDDPKSYRIELSKATIGTVEVAGGAYTMLVHRDGAEAKIRLTEVRTGTAVDIAAKVETGDQKFDNTEVHSRGADGAKQITEICLGGTKLRIAFHQGS